MRDRPRGRRGQGQPDPGAPRRHRRRGRRRGPPAPGGELNFDEAVAFLDRHIDLEKSKAVAGRVEGLSLDRIEALVHVLGDPHLAAPVIHLTGTNGKGSTSRMLSVLLRANGVLTGSYTSPHLESITERIAVAGEPITEEDLGRVIGDLAELEPVAGVRASYFELLTAAAFAHFAEVAVDVAVLEVGLLGRYDATNVARADVAVVTNVARDHTDAVGDWRRRVASEKAGIIEPDSHVVCGETDPELVGIFLGEGGREQWVRDRDFGVEETEVAVGGRTATLLTPYAGRTEVLLPVHGAHQADNAALALAAAEAFFGRALHPDVVAAGFEALTLPGRFEVVNRTPLVVIDAAHNPDGMTVTAATLAEEFTVSGATTAIVGLLAGRDPAAAVAALAPAEISRVVAVRPDSPRAVDPEEIRRAAEAAGLSAEVVEDPAEALRRSLDRCGDLDAVLVTGSFYSAGATRTAARSLGLLPDHPD